MITDSWKAGNGGSYHPTVVYYAAGVICICEDPADAPIIAALPELLVHLTKIVDAYGVGDGGKHVGRFIEEARPLVEQLRGNK